MTNLFLDPLHSMTASSKVHLSFSLINKSSYFKIKWLQVTGKSNFGKVCGWKA